MQDLINSVITAVDDANMRDVLYDTIGCTAGIAAVVFGVWYGRKLNFSLGKALGISVFELVFLLAIMQPIVWLDSGFKTFGAKNFAATFAYIPIAAYLSSKIFKISWKKASDFMAIPMMTLCGLARVGCIFTGCCRGCPVEWGIFNPQTRVNVFPIQLIESVFVILIIIVLLYRAKKRGYQANGLQTPMALVIYGVGRFFLEFLHDDQKFFLGCSKNAFHSLFMLIVGVCWILITNRHKTKKQQDAFILEE